MAASIGSWIFLKIDFSEFVLKLHKAFSEHAKARGGDIILRTIQCPLQRTY